MLEDFYAIVGVIIHLVIAEYLNVSLCGVQQIFVLFLKSSVENILLSFLHIVDEATEKQLKEGDKLAKVHPLNGHLQIIINL